MNANEFISKLYAENSKAPAGIDILVFFFNFYCLKLNFRINKFCLQKN